MIKAFVGALAAAGCAAPVMAQDAPAPAPTPQADEAMSLWPAAPSAVLDADALTEELRVDPDHQSAAFVSRDGSRRLYFRVDHERNRLWMPGFNWRDRMTIEGVGWAVGGALALEPGADMRAELQQQTATELQPDGFAVTLSYVRKF